MKPPMQVTIVGSACVDLAVRTQTLPRAGETVVGGEFSRLPGGKGANQAVATARLGAPVQFEGCVGADEHGQLLRDALAIEGVDLGRLRTVDTPTAVSVLQIDVEVVWAGLVSLSPGLLAAGAGLAAVQLWRRAGPRALRARRLHTLLSRTEPLVPQPEPEPEPEPVTITPPPLKTPLWIVGGER